MGIHLAEQKISFFSVPKCAGTSLKAMFFEVENGRPFEPFTANGEVYNAHTLYPSRPFATEMAKAAPDHWKVTIVRDPVARVLSTYGNRVVHGEVMKHRTFTDDERNAGLVPVPDLSTFVRLLPRYQEISQSVEHHTRPLSYFLGTDPGYYDRIFRLSEMRDFMAELGQRVSPLPEAKRLGTKGPKFTVEDLSAEERARIETLYEEDYRLFGQYF